MHASVRLQPHPRVEYILLPLRVTAGVAVADMYNKYFVLKMSFCSTEVKQFQLNRKMYDKQIPLIALAHPFILE